MSKPQTYTISELETESGFDRRTIAYYISAGLLPKVGRRGPRTTYPQEFLDRLTFVKRVRDLQDAGQLRAATLSEIAPRLKRLSAEELREAAHVDMPDEWVRGLFDQPDWGSTDYSTSTESVLAQPGEDQSSFAPQDLKTRNMPSARRRRMMLESRFGADRMREPLFGDDGCVGVADASADTTDALTGGAIGSDEDVTEQLDSLLNEIDDRAKQGADESVTSTGERLTRVPVTDDILLSVRNISTEDVSLVEKLAEYLRAVMGRD